MPSLDPGEAAQYNRVSQMLLDDLRVRSGPFQGMRYPGPEAAGSALTPKLLGTYEQELHPVLERLITKNYTDFIDIGCAEGYYAIGMALRLPRLRVHAYDTLKAARQLCQSMAELNGVAERVSVQAVCTQETLIRFPISGPTLVVCDCETYEKQLFTPSVAEALRHCDILIETHDFMDLSISTRLEEVLGATHHLTSVASVDDIQKAKRYHCPELEGLSVPVKFQILREARPMIMEWLIAEAR